MDDRLLNAYDLFLQTGKVEDYLQYVQVQQLQKGYNPLSPQPKGGQSAYRNRWDRPAGTGG